VNPRNFFAELKRRNVYKVAVAYAVVAWLLIQAASILFPTFEAPSWVMKVFVAVVLLGFPLALLFAWAFELTPEGLKRTEEVVPQQSITRKTGRKLIAITAALAVAALGLFVFQLARSRSGARVSSSPTTIPSPSSAAGIPEKSIAVLPFENLSRDPDNAFFASGIQDEILTALAKISGLKVISRKSTARYDSSPEDLPEIARQLGVAHILEGSVQKAADKVHINLQLIRAASDAHVWAQTYDRSLADIFAVEAEVARSVAQELQAKLTPEEKARVETKPTENSDAYVLYLRANEYADRPSDLLEDEQRAVELYTKAIALDPSFARARAFISCPFAPLSRLPADRRHRESGAS
jgi:TolB-like protein